MPKVSVIIPTHNRADLLHTAVSSVIGQTFEDWEIIVVDDHCKDHTTAVVNSFNDQRVRILHNEGENGPSIARNLGISVAMGKYIAFLDDDDEWFNHKLEKQISILETCSGNVCGIYSNRLMIEKLTGNTFSDDPGVTTLKGNLLAQLMIKNPIHTSTLIVKKQCLNKIGHFDENMRYMEDRDLWTRLSMHWDFEYINEPLIKAFYHGNEHLSHNLEGQIQGREIFLERYKDQLKNYRKNWSKFHVCLGAQYCQLRKMSSGRRNLFKGILIYPWNTIALFHLITSLLGADNYQRLRKHYKSSQIA